jgi:TonB family protein
MTDRRHRLRGTFDSRGDDAADALSSAARGEAEELELKSLLESWRVHRAPSSALRARLVVSYRQQFATEEEEQEMEVLGLTNTLGRAALAGARGEFRLTILESESLPRRLAKQLSDVARDSRLTREEFRRDPFGFTRRLVEAYASLLLCALAQENVGYGVTASLAVVLASVFAVVALDHNRARGLSADRARDDVALVGMIGDVPKEQAKPDGSGAGNASGHGGGQKPKFERPGGGGGGGRLEDKPAVNGKLAQATLQQQVLAPDPHPQTIKNPHLPTVPTLQADPVLFPTDTRPLNYGDPKSGATELSSGSGSGNGIGDGTGGGVGPGNGTGYGHGDGYNTGGGPAHIGGGGGGRGLDGDNNSERNRIFKVGEVTRRAVINSRPEPLYTDEARKEQITGTVVLRLVLNADGTVTNIVPLNRLGGGLTEKAIEAARRIQFTPAERDGRRVSQYATINYNFNIY